MDLKRFFVDEKITDAKVKITGDEFYHAIKVTRHKIGYKLILCDNGTKDYYATVTDIGPDYFTARIDEIKENDTESDYSITLFIANNKNLDEVIQKAIELGVTEIVPFYSQHCNIDSIKKDRLKKIISESSKQCGRSRLATVCDLISFDEMLLKAKNMQTFAFYEYERENKVRHSTLTQKNIGVIIGCEGGFSQEEIASFRQNGIQLYTLGKCILRVPTAVVSALTLINEKTDENSNF